MNNHFERLFCTRLFTLISLVALHRTVQLLIFQQQFRPQQRPPAHLTRETIPLGVKVHPLQLDSLLVRPDDLPTTVALVRLQRVEAR